VGFFRFGDPAPALPGERAIVISGLRIPSRIRLEMIWKHGENTFDKVRIFLPSPARSFFQSVF
jgi:hypothetical protein